MSLTPTRRSSGLKTQSGLAAVNAVLIRHEPTSTLTHTADDAVTR